MLMSALGDIKLIEKRYRGLIKVKLQALIIHHSVDYENTYIKFKIN